MLNLLLNDKNISLEDSTINLAKLVKKFNYNEDEIAIVLNNEVIRRDRWNDLLLKEGDIVKFLEITYGG